MQMVRRWFTVGLAMNCARLYARQDQDTEPQPFPRRPRHEDDGDARLPNGKLRDNAIADEEHKKALDEAQQLIEMSQKLKQELNVAGKFVVPMTAIRRTEDIEKLAKKIRGRLRM
jgi:hypothetical protein